MQLPSQAVDGKDVPMKQLGIFDEMSKIGLRLREAREGLSKSLEDIHEETRITTEHLSRLEEGDFTFLPETYVRSFLKTYAQRVGLDSSEMLQEYGTAKEHGTETASAQSRLESENSHALSPRSPRKGTSHLPQQAAKPTHSTSRYQFIEWALMVGIFLLAASLIGAYIVYRSTIKNSRSSVSTVHPADVELAMNQRPDGVEQAVHLQRTARERLTLWLKIDNTELGQQRLEPTGNLMPTGEKNFEGRLTKVDPPDPFAHHGDSNEVVRLSLPRGTGRLPQN